MFMGHCSHAWFVHRRIAYPYSKSLNSTDELETCVLQFTEGGNIVTPTYRNEVPEGFLHHISVEILLERIQQGPLLLGEVHSHILKGHWVLKHLTCVEEDGWEWQHWGPRLYSQEVLMMPWTPNIYSLPLSSDLLLPCLHSLPLKQQFWCQSVTMGKATAE